MIQTEITQNFCMDFNSSKQCPKTCPYIHSEDQKKRIQELYKLDLYIKAPSGLFVPRKDMLSNFFDHMKSNKICFDYYIFDKCVHGKDCWFHHISKKDQKHPQLPKLPGNVRKFEEHKIIDEEWHQKKCNLGEKCLKKKTGCPFFHGEEIEKKDEGVRKSTTCDEGESDSKSGFSTDKKEISKFQETIMRKNKEKEKEESEEGENEESDEQKEEENEESDEELEETNEEKTEEIEKTCEKCKKKKATCIFIPCFHCLYCMGCAEKVYILTEKKCSLCWKKVEFMKIKD